MIICFIINNFSLPIRYILLMISLTENYYINTEIIINSPNFYQFI